MPLRCEFTGRLKMPQGLKDLLFPNPGTPIEAVDYSPPTGVADLMPGSEIQTILDGSVYPFGDKERVMWFPVVGQTSETVLLTPAILFAFASREEGTTFNHLVEAYFVYEDQAWTWLIEELLEIAPWQSDLQVPVNSQRNGMSEASFDIVYFRHSHGDYELPQFAIYGEQNSPVIGSHIDDLLSMPLSGITLEAYPITLHFPETKSDVFFIQLKGHNGAIP